MSQTHSLDLESGSSQYASISDASQTGLDITGDFTIEAWVNFESLPPSSGNAMVIASKWTSTSNRSYEVFVYNSSGSYLIFVKWTSDGSGSGGTNQTLIHTTNSVINSSHIGQWIHIAVTADVSVPSASIYLNGQSQALTNAQTDGTSVHNGTAPFIAGSHFEGSQKDYLDGKIKDLRVFSDIRTQSEIISDAHTENVVDANLQGEWNFNNAYTDSSGNGNDLTASGSPVFSTDIPWEGASAISGSTYMETNLVSYWQLDEESGTRADAHGSNDLTDNNTVGFTTGIINNGADFVRSNSEYLSITDAAQSGLDVSDFTLSFWMNADNLSQDFTVIAAKGDVGVSRSYELYLRNDGSLHIFIFGATSGAREYRTGSGAISADTTYHIVFTFDESGDAGAFYRNGSLITTTEGGSALTGGVLNSTAPFMLGARLNSGSPQLYYDGWQDEFGIYSRALHYGDVLELYGGGAAIPYTGGGGETAFIPKVMMF